MNLTDIINAVGAGAVRGGAGLLDTLGSLVTYPFREGYKTIQDIGEYVSSDEKKRKELREKQAKEFKERGFLGNMGNMFTGVDASTQAANQAGLLNAPRNKTEAYAQSVGEAIPGVFLGGSAIPGLARKGLMAIGSGLGAQFGGDVAEKLAPGYETAGRVAGSILGGLPAATVSNPALMQRTVKPNLTDEEIGIVRALEKKPKYAPYFADKIKSEDQALLDSLKDRIQQASRTKGETNNEVVKLLSKSGEVDTSPIISYLKSHIDEVEGTAPGSGGESVRYARDMIRRVENQKNPYALHKLKQEVGMFTKDPNAPSVTKDGIARPLYGELSRVLDNAAPGYSDLMRKGNEARQAQVLSKELSSSEALSKGDPAKALDRFSTRVIQNEIKDNLDDVSPSISDILRQAEQFRTTYAERGGSGARIAQNAAQAQASKDFNALDITQAPNRIVGSVVNPIKDTRNFLRVTEGANPYMSAGLPAVVAAQAHNPEAQAPTAPAQPIKPLDLTPGDIPEMDFEQFMQLRPEKKTSGSPEDMSFDDFLKLGQMK